MAKELIFQKLITLGNLFAAIYSMLVNSLLVDLCILQPFEWFGNELLSFVFVFSFQVNSETGRITLSLKQSCCSSTDASFMQEYFLLEEKVKSWNNTNLVFEISWCLYVLFTYS